MQREREVWRDGVEQRDIEEAVVQKRDVYVGEMFVREEVYDFLETVTVERDVDV